MLFFKNPSLFLPVNISDSNNSAIQTFYFSFNEEYKEIILRLTDTFYGFLTSAFLCLLYISHIIRNYKNKNYDFIYYAAGLTVLPIMSLCIKSTDIPLYWIKHFSIILPLLAFAFIELENYKKAGFYASIAVLILILSRALIFQRSFSPGGMLQSINNKYLQINMYYAEKEYWTKTNRFNLFEDLKEIVKPNKDGIISFCSHYDSSVRPYFMYRPNVVSKRFFYKNFDNSDEYDYYILSKPVQDDEIPKFYYLIEHFANGEIGNSKYSKIYDKYDTVVYKKGKQ